LGVNARLPALLCALSVAGAVAGGCGGSGEATPPPPPPRQAAAALPAPVVQRAPVAQAPVSRSRAIAFARAVNLTAADLADAHASNSHEKEGSGHEGARCGSANQRKLADVSSPRLTRGSQLETEQIGSFVTVYASEAAAKHELAALNTGSGRSCVVHLLRQRFVGKTIGTAGARITKPDLTPAVAGSPARSSVGIRIAMSFASAAQEASIPAYGDFFAFTRGPAVVSYYVISGAQPEPATVEQQLGARLAGRASALSL
jgi:hypothetical protein